MGEDELTAPEATDAPDLGGSDLRAELERLMAEAPEADTTDATETDQAPATASLPTPGEGRSAPASWTKDAKADWGRVPANLQAEILRREHEVQSTLSETTEARKLHEQLAPYVAQIKEAGAEPAEYLANLIGWNAALRQQPAQAIATLAQQFIGDPQSARAVVRALQQAYRLEDDYDIDDRPAERGPNPQVVQLEERIRAQEIAAATREWSDFKSAKLPDGTPAHPHAEKVRAEIADAIRSNSRLSFSEAYERAVWVNPETRAAMLQAEMRAKAKAERDAATKAKARNLPRGRSDDGPANSRNDLRAELREQMARSGVRIAE
jgi:hypothetical protein